ncbi:protein kinase, putative, partial [Bodo saltans]
MLAANEECPPSPLPQFPPPSSKFEDYGFGVWSEDHWDAAEEAAELFPDPYKSTLLQLCCSRGPSAAWCFLLVYQNAYANFTNVTVVPSPLLWTAPVVVETAQPVALAASTAKELPDASMFAYNDGSWGPKDWKRAREVAARFPDDAKAQGRLMVRCHYNDEEGFVLAYQELIQQVSSRHFSPLGHLKRCIRTTMKKKNITVPWVKVEGVTSIVSTLSYFVASSGAAYTFTNRTIVPRSGGNMWNMRPICAVKLPPSCTGHTMLEPHQVCKGVVHVL